MSEQRIAAPNRGPGFDPVLGHFQRWSGWTPTSQHSWSGHTGELVAIYNLILRREPG